MRQITTEMPESVRIEPSPLAGFVEVVTVTNIVSLPVTHEDGQESTEYESDIYRLSYPAREGLKEYVEENFNVFVELAKAEEVAGKPTLSADRLTALMIENGNLRTLADKNAADIDYIAMMSDIALDSDETEEENDER